MRGGKKPLLLEVISSCAEPLIVAVEVPTATWACEITEATKARNNSVFFMFIVFIGFVILYYV
jgi:hypothetical protein